MKRSTKRKKKASAPPQAKTPSRAWLLAILLLALMLRSVGLDEPIGGFHGFNEANYQLIAQHCLDGRWLDPTPDGHYLFLETPPLFPWLMALAFSLFGTSVLVARWLTVWLGLGVVFATYLLGESLSNRRTALIGALVVAVCPVTVLTGRNIQTDAAFLLLLLLGLVVYLRARERENSGWVAAGALFGGAVMAKLFAGVAAPALAVWETMQHRGLRWLARSGPWKTAAIAAAPAALFYAYHLARNPQHVLTDVLGGAAKATPFPTNLGQWSGLLIEAFWALSPLIAVLALVATIAAVRKPSASRLLLLLLVASYGVFYLFVHKHSYYLASLVPFLGLLIGDSLDRLDTRWLRNTLLIAGLTPAVLLSALDIAAMKRGYRSFEQLGQMVRKNRGDDPVLLVNKDMMDSYSRLLQLYVTSADIKVIENTPVVGQSNRLDLDSKAVMIAYFVPATARPATNTAIIQRALYGLTLFGHTVVEVRPNPHFFQPGPMTIRRTGSLGSFGYRSMAKLPHLALQTVPAGHAVIRVPGGVRTEALD